MQKLTGLIGPIENLKIESSVNVGSKFSFLFYIKKEEEKNEQQYSYSSLDEIMYNENVCLKNFEVKSTAFTNFPIILRNQSEEILENNRRTLNILIVDDDFFSLMALKTNILKIKNTSKNLILNKVFEASGGENCLEIFKENNANFNEKTIDIIITDALMPIVDGFEVYKKIVKLCAEQNYIKPLVIGHTALSSEYSKNSFDLVLKKPAQVDEIEKILSNAMLN